MLLSLRARWEALRSTVPVPGSVADGETGVLASHALGELHVSDSTGGAPSKAATVHATSRHAASHDVRGGRVESMGVPTHAAGTVTKVRTAHGSLECAAGGFFGWC